MHWFYSEQVNIPLHTLDPEESKHCCSVLRLKAGETVGLVDGRGGYYLCRIVASDPRGVSIEVDVKTENYGARDYRLHIALAPPKNTERWEWFIEKATEIGVDEITPILCHRSERKLIKPERTRKIFIAAIKQSKQAWLPVLHPLTSFSRFIEEAQLPYRFIACEQAGIHLADRYRKGQDAVIIIGPEGGFTDDEISMAVKHNFTGVHLGSHILRTETAGLVACSTVAMINAQKVKQ